MTRIIHVPAGDNEPIGYVRCLPPGGVHPSGACTFSDCWTCTVHVDDGCARFRCDEPGHRRPSRLSVYGADRHRAKGHDVRPVPR